MKYHGIGLAMVTTGLVLAGCYTPQGTPDRTASGALAGGAIGAGTGAIIGNYSGHHTAEGALIGGAIGALTGGLIGHSMEEAQRETLQQQSPQTLQRVEQGQPLGQADIKALAKAGVSDEVLISQIRNSRSVYHLTTAEIIDLKDSGVTERVIDYMINTPATVSSAAPPPPPPASDYQEGVVVAEPPPPPVVEGVYRAPGPGYVWIGGSWTWYGGRWVWVRGRWAWPPHRRAVWIGSHWERRGGSGVWISGYWR